MKNTKVKKIKDVIFGLMLIAVAVLFILRSADIDLPLLGGISMLKIIGALVVITFIVFRLVDKKLSMFLMGLAVLYGIFLEEIASLAGIAKSALPSFWIVLLASVVIELGIKLIFKKRSDTRADGFTFVYDSDGDDDDDDERESGRGSGQGIGGRLGDFSQYIDCRNFKYADLGKRIGQINVYFDNTDEYESGGELSFSKMVGEATVYVPEDWDVRGAGSGFVGEMKIDPPKSEGGKILTVNCDKMVGTVRVIRR